MYSDNIIAFPARKVSVASQVKQSLVEKLTGPVTELEAWQAIAEDRIEVHYQPQYHLETGELFAAEALVRLVDEDGTLIYPDAFIEMAENSGMIAPLGRKVIALSCEHLAGWRKQGLRLEHVSINLSAHQLEIDEHLIDFIADTLAHDDLDFTDLEFELTERQYLTPDSHSEKVLKELANLGSRVVIDDFGVGYGSNLYLTELPVSAFKLDIAMIRRLGVDARTTSVIKHLMQLAADLELDVVAEGVETESQIQLLKEFGCDFGQGYYFGKPMTHLCMMKLVEERKLESVRVRPYLVV